VANDVCSILSYKNAPDAVGHHCKGLAYHDIPTMGGTQTHIIIPVRDLYRLVMKSKSLLLY
jgi:prophage antirepressor-like protein